MFEETEKTATFSRSEESPSHTHTHTHKNVFKSVPGQSNSTRRKVNGKNRVQGEVNGKG